VTDEPFRDILTIISLTGCRPFEAARVTAKDVRPGCWEFPKKESKGKKRGRVVFLVWANSTRCSGLSFSTAASSALLQLWNHAARTDLPPSFSGFGSEIGHSSSASPDEPPANMARAGTILTKVRRSMGYLFHT